MTENKDASDAAEERESAEAVGRFVTNFNGLDNRLNHVLGILLNPRNVAVGEIVGAALTLTNKRLCLKALVDLVHGPDESAKYNKIDRRLSSINSLRNDVAHGEPIVDFEGLYMQSRPSKLSDKGFSWNLTFHSPDEILGQANEVIAAQDELWEYVRGLPEIESD